MWFKLTGANFKDNNLGKMSELSNQISITYNSNNGFTAISNYVLKNSATTTLSLTLKSNWTYTHNDNNVTVTNATKDTTTYDSSNGTLSITIIPSSGSTFGESGVSNINVNINGAQNNGGEEEEPETPVNPPSGGNEITWYINSLQQLQDSGNNIAANRVELAPSSAYHWVFNQFNAKLAGKTINTIELMPCKSGTLTIGIFDTSSNTVTDTRSIIIDAADINTIKTYTFNDLTIPSNKYFTWNCSGKSATGGEAAGYYVLKAKLDPLAVETSQWYQAKSTGLVAFGTHELVFVANIGYTG